MRNPESAFLCDLSKKLEEEKRKRALSSRAEEVFTVNPPLNPREFKGVVGFKDEDIARDVTYTSRMEQVFNEESTPEQKELKKFAKILEAMLNELIELYDWLGPDATTITTSDFDDIKNGVDIIAEFQDEEEKSASHLALAVDVTFARDVSDKFERIKREIERGELTRVKYFKSGFLEQMDTLTDVPRVIIGADVDSIKSLGKLWLAKDKKALAVHEMQKVVLEEIRGQLEVFAKYAHAQRQESVAKIYEKTLHIIQDILQDKHDIPIKALREDRVFGAITREVSRLEREV
ncbi:MAG: hypothetical protein A3J08_01550 [Candidatus Lloydbacteria bacterium RIFCSPLOWO2_02_FULL_51_11]|uniref:Uncharacterized protein n=1 Tax=Candidatus Lloydbacteria bacterium RIFCSPLOWO2_02_FULL_51_11 TaxID=1798667 RepID=A0A1G2DMX5_9BACT|nr:MAG: hypothetical protein A3J08_01550 [Candidatus Lloydbacteria bacterium RIFCSPLOWO2_02_FULL_51_11]